jgi:hypothetical protein
VNRVVLVNSATAFRGSTLERLMAPLFRAASGAGPSTASSSSAGSAAAAAASPQLRLSQQQQQQQQQRISKDQQQQQQQQQTLPFPGLPDVPALSGPLAIVLAPALAVSPQARRRRGSALACRTACLTPGRVVCC